MQAKSILQFFINQSNQNQIFYLENTENLQSRAGRDSFAGVQPECTNVQKRGEMYTISQEGISKSCSRLGRERMTRRMCKCFMVPSFSLKFLQSSC